MKAILGVAGTMLLAVSLVACDASSVPPASTISTVQPTAPAAIKEAADACTWPTNEKFVLGDSGASVIITGNPEYYPATATKGMQCMLPKLHVTDALWARMIATRPIDGTMTANWDSYEASWSATPTAGLNIVISTKR